MSENNGPWEGGPEKPSRRPRPELWLGVLALAAAAVWILAKVFPGAVTDRNDAADVLAALGALALVSAGLVRARLNLGRGARHLAVWIAVIAVLAVGYSFRGAL